MKSTISKELLSEVLVEDINDIVNDKTTPKNLFQYEIKKIMLDGSNVAYREINIHELAHKCKEWAMQLYPSYSIDSGIEIDLNFQAKTDKEVKLALQGIVQGLYGYSKINLDRKQFTAKTEPEAIFAACQWILDNKDK